MEDTLSELECSYCSDCVCDECLYCGENEDYCVCDKCSHCDKN